MEFLLANSRRLYAALASSVFAPIEVPALRSCAAICRGAPGLRDKTQQNRTISQANRNVRSHRSRGLALDIIGDYSRTSPWMTKRIARGLVRKPRGRRGSVLLPF